MPVRPGRNRVRIESRSFYWWAPKGLPLCAEANGGHKGVNVIGATEILKTFKPYYSIYSSWEGIEAPHVGRFVDKLMRKNPNRGVWVILDNYPPHRSIASEYERKYQGRLHFTFLPSYSPKVNPGKDMWALLKDYCALDSAIQLTKNCPKGYASFSYTPTEHQAK